MPYAQEVNTRARAVPEWSKFELGLLLCDHVFPVSPCFPYRPSRDNISWVSIYSVERKYLVWSSCLARSSQTTAAQAKEQSRQNESGLVLRYKINYQNSSQGILSRIEARTSQSWEKREKKTSVNSSKRYQHAGKQERAGFIEELETMQRTHEYSFYDAAIGRTSGSPYHTPHSQWHIIE